MNTKLTASLMALALTTPVMCAQEVTAPQQEQVQTAEVQAPETDYTAPLVQDPQMHTGVLENGLKYIIRPTKEPRGRACVRLFVDTGSLNETPENSGISHFIEHMVFNGSRTFKRGELIPTMEKLGLGFGGDANAYTSFLQTVYMIDMPKLDDETVNFAMTIVRDFADGATLEDDAIDHERGIVISELHSRDSEAMRAQIQMMRILTPGTRLADYTPIGKEEVIRDAPYSVVRDYYRDHYVPSNMTLIITGDVSYEQAEGWINKHFSSMEARTAVPREPLGTPQNTGEEEYVLPVSEMGNVNINVAIVRPHDTTPDSLQKRIADLPLELATSLLNKRLQRMSRKPGCPFLSASAGKDDLMQISDLFTLGVTTTPDKWEQGLKAAEAELRSAITYGFNEDEFREVLTEIATHLQQACVTWESVTAPNMASKIVESLSDKFIFTDPKEDLRSFEAAIMAIAQDPDICRRALEEAYNSKSAKVIAMGGVPEALTPEALRTAYQESLQQEAPRPAEFKAAPFAYDNIGEPGKVVAQQHYADIDTTTVTLSNGVRVNLKATQSKKDTIGVTAMVDGGSIHLPSTPGLTSILSTMMSTGGLEAHTIDEMMSIFAGKRVSTAFDVQEDRFAFSGSTNRKDFELQCKLLVADILHPGYRDDGEHQMRQKLPAIYKKLTTTADGVFSTGSSRTIYGDDPRFNMPTLEEMQNVHTADAKAAIAPFLKDGAIEVTIVGDFDLQETLPILERTFGAMPQRKAEFTPITDEQRSVKLADWGQTKYLPYPSKVDKTIVAQVWPAGDGMDRQRNRRVQVLTSIVSQKLFDGLRANLGQSYSPIVRYAANDEYKGAGMITMMSYGVKGNRALVDSAINCICSLVGRGNISEDEFQCALRPVISRLDKEMSSNAFWQGNLARIQSNPDSLERLRHVKADFQSITYEEIVALAKEIFGKDTADHFFVLPDDYDKTPEGQPAEQPAEQPAAEEPAAPAEEADSGQAAKEAADAGATSYVVVMSKETAEDAEWKAVADALVAKYSKDGWTATCVVLDKITKAGIVEALQQNSARYAAYVMKPAEIGRARVATLHRAARMVDDDPFGDCLWGIVTGYTAKDAMRIAQEGKPLVIKRLLGTTNVGPDHFEYSYCITDWTGFPVLEQEGYKPPTQTTYTSETPEGGKILQEGTQSLFAERLENAKSQLIVTSSHATQFNLEMPFSKGLILPSNNRFYQLPIPKLRNFGIPLSQATRGNVEPLKAMPAKEGLQEIKPDGNTRVWLAAGNCLIGDAHKTDQSMVVTALSAYTCNQFVGYTVPSWFGEGGWGTLSCFFDGADGTPLAEAWFINNQFILNETINKSPELLKVEFNQDQIGRKFMMDMDSVVRSAKIARQDTQRCVGLVHDRDVVAFYGDPAWSASLDCSHSHCPYAITWNGPKQFTITANGDRKGRLGVWFPTAETGKDATGCDVEGAVFTNDFVLFPELDMKKGDTKTVNIK